MHARPDDALLLAPLPASLGDGTAASPRWIVDVWLAVPRGPGWLALLLKRRPDQGGFWQGVSGGVEPSDPHLLGAARREIGEETGYTDGVEVFDLGRWIEFTSRASGRTFVKRSLGAVLPVSAGPAGLRLSDEHEDARLVSFDEARGLVSFPENVDELTTLETLVRDRGGRG
jgi:8-oxo-dGTP pyrophosphatase MutT (NUDIX family)